MPKFNCRMLTPQGQIIRSTVEEASRLACIRKLRRNGLTPISVRPVLDLTGAGKQAKAEKKTRNIKPTANFETRREARNKKSKNKKAQGGIWDLLNVDIGGGAGGRKPSARDIRVFTQNFYLLKKANFF